MSTQKAAEIIADDFTTAQRLMSYHPDDLRTVLGWYPKKIQPGIAARYVEDEFFMITRELDRLTKLRQVSEGNPPS